MHTWPVSTFLERSDVYELHHRTSTTGPASVGNKKRKKSFRSIDPLSRTPHALDLTRSALHELCSVHIQCTDRKSSVHCMPCSKKKQG